MKKLLWIILPLLVFAMTAVSASAAQYVYDYGDVLTDTEEAYLENLAEKESEKHGISIVLLTEDGIGGEDPLRYAADFYDYGGFLDDGVIMFLEMEERDWNVVNTGIYMNIIGDYELDYIGEYAVPYFSSGDYREGFEQFIIIASALYDEHINGEFTGEYELTGYNPDGSKSLFYPVSLGISLLIAFLVCSGFKQQLNTAVKQNHAANYIAENNAELTHSSDRFLYSRTTKIKKASDSSSGSRSFSGSSGRSHSGGGGKF